MQSFFCLATTAMAKSSLNWFWGYFLDQGAFRHWPDGTA
jgi:hypothetical protein